MRSAIVTSIVIGGAHSVAAEILRGFTRQLPPGLLSYVMSTPPFVLDKELMKLKDEISLICIKSHSPTKVGQSS
jgi:hypothetical protein